MRSLRIAATGIQLARYAAALTVPALVLAAPGVVSAHGLQQAYVSPLPLPVYLAGAAATVGLSFVFVLARDVRATTPGSGRTIAVPVAVRLLLRALGLVAWGWIVLQGVVGGSSAGAVAPLFLLVYGWVGLAAVSPLVGPIWRWLDPFATLHDIGAWILRTARIPAWEPAELPPVLRGWPAAIGMFVVIWLELVQGAVSSVLFVTLVAYTAFTLAMMAQFGRDTWRAHGETFSVWFAILGRLAPFALVPITQEGEGAEKRATIATDDTRVRSRPFASGLLDSRWTNPEVVIVAFGVGSILYDGLSQTRPFFYIFGSPMLVAETLILSGFLGLIAGAALGVARAVSPGAIGAGLVPIAVGYLIAHYLSYLLVDGQWIMVAISDPLQQGDDLFGTAFYLPDSSFLSPGLTWTIQLAAVVGGHMVGAWAGHVVAARDAERPTVTDGPGEAVPAGRRPDVRLREVPLALVMVGLTSITLWSLGQAIFVTETAQTDKLIGYGAELGIDLSSALTHPDLTIAERDLEDAMGVGVRGTPTFFVDGTAVRLDGIRAAIEARLGS